jgi:hypothetical protein
LGAWLGLMHALCEGWSRMHWAGWRRGGMQPIRGVIGRLGDAECRIGN